MSLSYDARSILEEVQELTVHRKNNQIGASNYYLAAKLQSKPISRKICRTITSQECVWVAVKSVEEALSRNTGRRLPSAKIDTPANHEYHANSRQLTFCIGRQRLTESTNHLKFRSCHNKNRKRKHGRSFVTFTSHLCAFLGKHANFTLHTSPELQDMKDDSSQMQKNILPKSVTMQKRCSSIECLCTALSV